MKFTEDRLDQKFHNKYRIPSARLRGYDYSSAGAYFITICTADRKHFFGEIRGGNMELSEIGAIVTDEWQKNAMIRENVALGAWVVMPNHIHGILVLYDGFDRDCGDCGRDVLPKRLYGDGGGGGNELPKRLYGDGGGGGNELPKRLYGDGGGGGNELPKRSCAYSGDHPKMSQISPTKHSLSNIIKFFKRQTTIRSRIINPDFAWQARFHDRIIRSANELNRISQYIIENPKNWTHDDYF